jgi:phosphoglycolate phosphatase
MILCPRYIPICALHLAIFDFDGTLLDSFAWFTGTIDEVAGRYDFNTIPADQTDAFRGLSAREVVRRLDVPAWKLPLIANHMRRLAARDRATLRLFDGAGDMLKALHGRGVMLAIVTSNTEQTVRDRLGPDLAALIHIYECGASLFGKPRKLRRAIARSGRPAHEALVIGDEIRDADAARAAGLAFGAVAWGFTTPDALRAQRPAERCSGPSPLGSPRSTSYGLNTARTLPSSTRCSRPSSIAPFSGEL